MTKKLYLYFKKEFPNLSELEIKNIIKEIRWDLKYRDYLYIDYSCKTKPYMKFKDIF